MSIVILCDADTKTALTPEEAQVAGWGLIRRYSPAAIKDVDEFSHAVLDAAASARTKYNRLVDKARLRFHTKYPDGLLPDEEAKDADKA